MKTPEELLCSRWWRIRNSGWMLWGILSLGLLTFVGYLYIGVKSRKWLWIAIGGVFLVYTIVIMTLMTTVEAAGKGQPQTPEQSAVSATLFAGLVAGAVSPWFFNRSWLKWRAHHNRNVPWYAGQNGPQPSSGQGAPNAGLTPANVFANPGLTPPPPQVPSVETPSASSAPVMRPPTNRPQATQTLDLNLADARQLSQLPGIDEQWARHIVAVRQQRGGFRSPDELVTAAGMQPHIFAQVRGALVVAPQPPQPRAAPDNHPRGQSFGGGRRLDF